MKDLKDVTERIYTVEEGIRQYVKIMVTQSLGMKSDTSMPKKETRLYVHNAAKDPKELPVDSNVPIRQYNTGKSATQPSLESERDNNAAWKYMTVKEKIQTIAKSSREIPDIELSDKDKEILRKLELEHERNIKSQTGSPASASATETVEKERVHKPAEPIERPTVKLSVKPKHSVRIQV